MKILFLCGCIEPGRDGVGDYTRKLAGEISRAGHSPAIISINDKMIDNEFRGNQESGGATIPVVRLPQNWDQPTRLQKVLTLIEDFNPDWVSLQFVPFSFHKKGLPYQLGRSLASARTKYWHIMIHELWVGMDKTAPLKFRVLRFLQQRLIKSLIKSIAPHKIHTQSSLYLAILQQNGISCDYLPLFGNMPVEAPSIPASTKQVTQPRIITFILFGGIHHGAAIKELAQELKNISAVNGSKIILKIIGRCGPEQATWEKEWLNAGLSLEVLGEQSPEFISRLFLSADFGLTTTPWLLVEKSGSVAAMHEHGLPILCVSRDWEVREKFQLKVLPNIVKYEEGKLNQFLSLSRHMVISNRSEIIAKQLLETLLPISHGQL
jgi:hypothetical protein